MRVSPPRAFTLIGGKARCHLAGTGIPAVEPR